MKEQVVNVAIDRELWKQVGIKAAIEQIDKKEIVDKALRKWLKENETNEYDRHVKHKY